VLRQLLAYAEQGMLPNRRRRPLALSLRTPGLLFLRRDTGVCTILHSVFVNDAAITEGA